MRVLNIGTLEMEIIEEALDYLGGTYSQMIQVEQDGKIKEEMVYKEAHIRTTCKIIKDQRLQELCERILGYVWSLYQEVDEFTDDILDIADDMGITEEELVELFKEAGFGEEE